MTISQYFSWLNNNHKIFLKFGSVSLYLNEGVLAGIHICPFCIDYTSKELQDVVINYFHFCLIWYFFSVIFEIFGAYGYGRYLTRKFQEWTPHLLKIVVPFAWWQTQRTKNGSSQTNTWTMVAKEFHILHYRFPDAFLSWSCENVGHQLPQAQQAFLLGIRRASSSLLQGFEICVSKIMMSCVTSISGTMTIINRCKESLANIADI